MNKNTDRKKILQVSVQGFGNGGVQAVIMNIVRGLYKDMDFDTLLFTSQVRYHEHEFESYGGKIFRIPCNEKKYKFMNKIDYYVRFPRILLRTYKIIKKNGPYDVIHCHNDYEGGICLLAAFLAGVKTRIIHIHRNDYRKYSNKYIRNIYNKFLYKLIDLFSTEKIACSEKSINSFYDKKNIKSSKVKVIYNGIDNKKFNINRVNKSKYQNKEIVITHVGQYCDNKNQMFLLDIIQSLKEETKDIKVKLVGFNDEYKRKLMDKSVELNIIREVEFLPPNSDIPKVLSNTDVFIFPSKSEGFGIALLEAQAMGVPCIVSDTVPDEVDLNLCKFISLEKNAKFWSDEILNILKYKNLYKLDRSKLDKFTNENILKEYKKIYN